jgi:hypothetical protein
MISEEVDERRARAGFVWALALSVLIHAIFLPLAFWSAGLKLLVQASKPPPQELIVASTAVRIEKRSVPRPMSRPNRATPVRPQPVQRPAQPVRPVRAVKPQRQPKPVAKPRELARTTPAASPEPSAGTPQPKRAAPTLAQQLAQQQRTFAQEVAQLRRQDNPLSVATSAPKPPSSYRRTYFDVPGHKEQQAVQAILIPLRHWTTGTLSCYYTRYIAQYVHGGSEEGSIPWPVCYPIDADRMINPPWVHNLPIPFPQPDYVLPAGTYLTPLLKQIYGARTQR